MHIADFDKGMLGANGIVGGGPPLVCGVGLTAKVKGTDQVARLVHRRRRLQPGHVPGEPEPRGAPGTCRSSSSSRTTATPRRPRATSTRAGIDVAKRADGFGMPGLIVDGFDFFAVHEAAGEAIARARSGGGPTLIECKVSRYYGHFEGDQQTYRGAERGRGPAPRRATASTRSRAA